MKVRIIKYIQDLPKISKNIYKSQSKISKSNCYSKMSMNVGILIYSRIYSHPKIFKKNPLERQPKIYNINGYPKISMNVCILKSLLF